MKAQEGVRKCVERVFGVLFTQFKIQFVPSQLMSSAEMSVIANSCVVMHNMIAEVRCESYNGDGGRGLSRQFNEAADAADMQMVSSITEDMHLRLQQMGPVCDDFQSVSENKRMRAALVDYIWNRKGANKAYVVD